MDMDEKASAIDEALLGSLEDAYNAARGAHEYDPEYAVENGWYSIADLEEKTGMHRNTLHSRLQIMLKKGTTKRERTMRPDRSGNPRRTDVWKWE